MTRLVDAGVVAEDWDDGEYGRGPQNSVVAFTVRGGNPKDIQDWDDLVRDDVEVITPNPFTSGGAAGTSWPPTAQRSSNGGTEEEALRVRRARCSATPGPGRERVRRARDVHRR